MSRVAMIAMFVTTALAVSPWAQISEPVDLDAVARIKAEGLERSEVMDTLWALTERYGARLTNSPNMHEAADWAVLQLRDWGISRVTLDPWGEFGRGWSNEFISVNVIEPDAFPIVAYSQAWTPGTDGPVEAEVVRAVIDDPSDFDTFAGKLTGRVVLRSPEQEVEPLFDPMARRLLDENLTNVEPEIIRTGRRGGGRGNGGGPNFADRRTAFFVREGVAAVIVPAPGRNDHGAVVVQGPSDNRDPSAPPAPPQLSVSTEHYNRLVRLVEREIPVRMRLDVQNQFVDDSLEAYNIVAEIPETDLADEVVMLGAHFDSWHTGTGATDNAVGVAATMEALRILQATGLTLRRTVRLALWTGEEQGLLGSRAYVTREFADRETMTLRLDHERISAYFNMDNGTGAIRGVYMEGNEAVRPIFAAWIEPLRTLGMSTLSIRSTGSTDHVPFNDVGLPGFQFIQDPVEYGTHSHHTSMDLYDRAQAADLMKNATIIASFVFHAANRDDRLPREALPAPRPQ